MKITRENLKNIVREAMVEESAYQEFFKKALEKTGKSIPQMSDEEKKAFFNKIDSAWKGKGEKKNEGNAFGAAVSQAKKDGDDSFKVDGEEYKVEGNHSNDDEEIDEEAAMVHRRTPSGTIVSKLKEENESVNELGHRYDTPKGFKSPNTISDILSADKIKINIGSILRPKYVSADVSQKQSNSVILRYSGNKTQKIYNDSKYLSHVFIKESVNESLNEEIKVGSSVTVNYPTLKKPVKGKVKHILKSPTGLVYVLDGDKGVWDAKNVSESVNEKADPKKFKKGFEKGDVIVDDDNSRYVIVSQRGKQFVVGDNGERREFNKGKVSKKNLKGNLSLSDVLGESVNESKESDIVDSFIKDLDNIRGINSAGSSDWGSDRIADIQIELKGTKNSYHRKHGSLYDTLDLDLRKVKPVITQLAKKQNLKIVGRVYTPKKYSWKDEFNSQKSGYEHNRVSFSVQIPRVDERMGSDKGEVGGKTYKVESVNEADVVGKTIFSDGKGKLFFGYYKTDDAVEFVDYKTWKKLSFKDVSKGDTNKERVIKAIVKNQKQFNKKVDFNMWAKKQKRSFEDTMDWFIQNGWINNINKGGIKESIDILSVNERIGSDKGEVGNANFKNRLAALKKSQGINKGDKVVVNYPTLIKPLKGIVAQILKSTNGNVYVLKNGNGVWDEKYIKLAESVNEAKTYTPKQVRQALDKMVKQLKVKWKQKGGYEDFGQTELRKFKDTFGYKPYGSSDEREIADLIDSFEDWTLDYSA